MSTTLHVDRNNASTFQLDMEGQIDPQMPLTERVARKLWAVGSATFVVDIGAGLHQPGSGSVFGGHKVAYNSILAGVLAVVAVEMATAFWLPRSNGRRLLAFAKSLLSCAVVLLLLVLAVGGFALTVKA